MKGSLANIEFHISDTWIRKHSPDASPVDCNRIREKLKEKHLESISLVIDLAIKDAITEYLKSYWDGEYAETKR